VLTLCCLQIFQDVHGRLTKLRKAAEQSTSANPLPGATQLQLAHTTLALLRLHPTHAYSRYTSAAAAAAADLMHDDDVDVAEELEKYRLEMLSLLCSEYHALRIRAGPLAAQLIAGAAVTAAAGAGSSSSSNAAVATAVTAAVAEVQQQLQLQRSARPDQQQAELQQLLQLHQSVISPDQEEVKKGLQRAFKSQLVCWDSATVQLADVAAAAAVVVTAAVQCEEPPNALDTLLLQLLCGHAAFVQQLPADLLPTYELCEANSKASQMRLAAAALDVISAEQQYSSRYKYLAYQAPCWIWQWFVSGRSFDQLLLLQPLLCPATAKSSSSSDLDGSKAAAAALLDRYGSSIVSSLLHADAEQELQAVADAAGCSTVALTDKWCWQITATLYPALSRAAKTDAIAVMAHKIAARMGLSSKVCFRDRRQFAAAS
jgi:hypothetical protein